MINKPPPPGKGHVCLAREDDFVEEGPDSTSRQVCLGRLHEEREDGGAIAHTGRLGIGWAFGRRK